MNQTISIKQLQENLPFIRRKISKGARFILSFRSVPIAEIRPLGDITSKAEVKGLETFTHPPKRLTFASQKSAVELVCRERV